MQFFIFHILLRQIIDIFNFCLVGLFQSYEIGVVWSPPVDNI